MLINPLLPPLIVAKKAAPCDEGDGLFDPDDDGDVLDATSVVIDDDGDDIAECSTGKLINEIKTSEINETIYCANRK